MTHIFRLFADIHGLCFGSLGAGPKKTKCVLNVLTVILYTSKRICIDIIFGDTLKTDLLDLRLSQWCRCSDPLKTRVHNGL